MSICNLIRSFAPYQSFNVMNKTFTHHESVKPLSFIQNPQCHLFSQIDPNAIKRLKEKSDDQLQLGLGLVGSGLWVTAITDFFLSPALIDLAATGGGAKVFLAGACNPMALYFFGCAVKEFSGSNQTQREVEEMEKTKEGSSTSDDPAPLILMHAAMQSSHEESAPNSIHSSCKATIQEEAFSITDEDSDDGD